MREKRTDNSDFPESLGTAIKVSVTFALDRPEARDKRKKKLKRNVGKKVEVIFVKEKERTEQDIL